MPTRLFITGNDDALLEPGIAQGAGHRLGHTATAAQGKGRIRIQAMLLEQLTHSQIIGVVGLEPTAVIDDGVDRLDGRRRRVDLVDQRHAGFLVRHRHTATANTQGANTAHGCGQVLGGHGLVVKIQAQLLVQMVVKAHPKGARTTRQGDAQDGVFTGNMGHLTLLSQSNRHYASSPRLPAIER
ncbi:hypothetical protein D3C80_1302650 [compost metagenome]